MKIDGDAPKQPECFKLRCGERQTDTMSIPNLVIRRPSVVQVIQTFIHPLKILKIDTATSFLENIILVNVFWRSRRERITSTWYCLI